MIGQQPVVIANEIRLWRAVHKGAFMLVEGRDDRLFYERFVDRITCKIRVVENKANVYEVIRVLETDGFLGVVGILDADFDLVEGRPAKSGNLVIGDSHDLESMLVRSPALDGILIEFGSADKIERFGRDIRTTMPQAAYPVACLRLYSERSGGMLRFDGLAYRRFLDRRTLNVDYTALVTEVKNCSQRLDIPPRTWSSRSSSSNGKVTIPSIIGLPPSSPLFDLRLSTLTEHQPVSVDGRSVPKAAAQRYQLGRL